MYSTGDVSRKFIECHGVTIWQIRVNAKVWNAICVRNGENTETETGWPRAETEIRPANAAMNWKKTKCKHSQKSGLHMLPWTGLWKTEKIKIKTTNDSAHDMCWRSTRHASNMERSKESHQRSPEMEEPPRLMFWQEREDLSLSKVLEVDWPSWINIHTYTQLPALCLGQHGVSLYQKGKTNLDFTEARDSEWQWHHSAGPYASLNLAPDR